MAKISVLDNQTIDKIAAGEVVERPASVIKELVENAIDSGASAITVEIKEGGITFLRVTDNGSGIEKTEVSKAFLRHATSKISSANDLFSIVSLGFRGEALASIAAVSMVELITKTKQDLTGIRYVIEGGMEKETEEIGAPDGTTIIVRNIFFNTPARKKFLKTAQTEAAYISDLMEHLALSNPSISFKYVINGQNRFFTSGNGDLKEVIYRIYGKDIAKELVPLNMHMDGVHICGYLGKPVINRANRNYEIFYVNGRYVKSSLLSKALEEGYREYLMQHKFPFCVLHFTMDPERIDVNVHPTKMEIRISDNQNVCSIVTQLIYDALHEQEMIPDFILVDKKEPKASITAPSSVPEPFETQRLNSVSFEDLNSPVLWHSHKETNALTTDKINATNISTNTLVNTSTNDSATVYQSIENSRDRVSETTNEQMNLFDEKILSKEAASEYEIIGQLFHTYWLISYQEKLLIVDQHAAHEKVKYERLMKHLKENSIVSQTLNPPIVITLNAKEEECLRNHIEVFQAFGFSIEEFGGREYCIRAVPMDLYGFTENDFFYEILDEISDAPVASTPESIRNRIATMACKAAVKGNMRMNREELQSLLDELFTLDNPYNCPHGRPTIISMTKYELEKKFKRIVT